MSKENTVTVEFLESFAQAWNKHDVELILACMTDNAVMQLGSGPNVHGSRFTGKAEIRQATEKLFSSMPDVMFNSPKHFIAGDRGVTEWVMTATAGSVSIEAEGCDIFKFENGLISKKNSYRKQKS